MYRFALNIKCTVIQKPDCMLKSPGKLLKNTDIYIIFIYTDVYI